MNCKYCFCDAEGRTWCLRLTAATFFRMRRELGELPDECKDPQRMIEGLMRFDSLAVILQAVLSGQLKQAGISVEQLLESLYGEHLEAAQLAFLEALADFFPNRAARQALRQAIEQAQKQAETAIETFSTSGMTPFGSMPA